MAEIMQCSKNVIIKYLFQLFTIVPMCTKSLLCDRPITGASMNPARSIGPAFVHHEYRGIWIYLVSPTLGAVAGALVYNTIRYTDKPVREITKSASFLRGAGRSGSSR